VPIANTPVAERISREWLITLKLKNIFLIQDPGIRELSSDPSFRDQVL